MLVETYYAVDFECTFRAGTLKIVVGYWFHNGVARRLDTDVISYSRLECTLGLAHIYFRITLYPRV